jgi:hypothetical protein
VEGPHPPRRHGTAANREDRAFYPLECGYDADGTWRVLRKGQLLPYTAPAEPQFDQQGAEGAVKIQSVRQMAALLRQYQLTGDAGALDVARRLARFVLKPSLWIDASAVGIAGNEHGMFEGHFHGSTFTLQMLATLAALDEDPALFRLVRAGYHHAQRFGVMPMGWFPAWTRPAPGAAWAKGRPPHLHNNRNEGCAVADMVILGVKLSDAGLGDYWDDVDHVVRNQLAEQQFTSLDLMRACGGGGNQHDATVTRFLGGFGIARVTHNIPRVQGSDTANCSVGLYYAWHGITRFHDGVATVNLFLNRASTWMDVDSYLPYEGKVVLRNKQAHTALVRLPAWVRRADVKAVVNGRATRPGMSGARLIFQQLKPGDEIVLGFPVPLVTREYSIGGERYRLTFRGSTIVDISPRQDVPGMYPSYVREHMKTTRAPMITLQRFAPHRELALL